MYCQINLSLLLILNSSLQDIEPELGVAFRRKRSTIFSGSCTFEMVPGYYGDTSFDFTPSNDEVHPYKSDEQCAELCLNSWSIYPHPDLRVVEECWGFTTSATECRLHNVLKPSYFDIPSNKISSSSTNLFIKRCFASKKNYSFLGEKLWAQIYTFSFLWLVQYVDYEQILVQ